MKVVKKQNLKTLKDVEEKIINSVNMNLILMIKIQLKI